MHDVFRVLKPGGRTVLAEVVLKRAFPDEVRQSGDDSFHYTGGALPEAGFLALIGAVGIERIEVLRKGRGARPR